MFCVVYVTVFVAYCECKEFLSCCRYCLLKLACSCETHFCNVLLVLKVIFGLKKKRWEIGEI